MYCMACGKEYETEMFCPECGRMLVSNNTFDYEKSSTHKEYNYQEELIAERERLKAQREEIKKKELEEASHNKPKCPTCGSTNIRHITATERGMNAVMFGVFGTKRKCQFECQNPNCKYRW